MSEKKKRGDEGGKKAEAAQEAGHAVLIRGRRPFFLPGSCPGVECPVWTAFGQAPLRGAIRWETGDRQIRRNQRLERRHFALTPPFMGDGGPGLRAPEGSLAG
ncbi:MAG: hypothetical protein V4671_11870, partial [Armatimonadota bacterium]